MFILSGQLQVLLPSIALDVISFTLAFMHILIVFELFHGPISFPPEDQF